MERNRPCEDTEERFVQLYTAHYPLVLAYCARRVGPDAAADVAAETFLIAWRRRDGARGVDLPWLLVTAGNCIRNSDRSSARQTALALRLAATTGAADVSAAAIDDVLDVRRALAAMPPAQAEALILTEWDRLPVKHAAQVAGCSEAAFRVRLHRARRRLAAELEPEPRASISAPTLPVSSSERHPL